MRYLPLIDADRRDMLAAIGVKSIDDLFAEVPQPARHQGLLDLPRAMGELEVERRLGAMAAKNTVAGAVPFFLGAGSYRHHVPAAVDVSRPVEIVRNRDLLAASLAERHFPPRLMRWRADGGS